MRDKHTTTKTPLRDGAVSAVSLRHSVVFCYKTTIATSSVTILQRVGNKTKYAKDFMFISFHVVLNPIKHLLLQNLETEVIMA